MTVSLGITIFALALILIGALRGLGRRFGRSMLRFIAVAAAATAAFIMCTNTLSDISLTAVDSATVEISASSPETAELIAEFIETFPETSELILAIPLSMLMPLFFVVLFFLFSVLAFVPYWILALILFPRKKRTPNAASRLAGLGIGAVQGLLVALIWLMPVAGFLGLADKALDTLSPSMSDNAEYTEIADTVSPIADEALSNPVVKLTSSWALKPVFTALTTYHFGQTAVVLEDEVTAYATIAIDVMGVGSLDFENMTPEQVAAIKDLAAHLEDAETLRTIAADVISKACQKWIAGEKFFGVKKPTAEDAATQRILDTALNTFSTSTPDTICRDIRSLADALEVLVKYDVLATLTGGGDITEILNNGEMLDELLQVVEESENIKEVVVEVAKVGISEVISSAAADPEDVEQVSQDIADAMADTLNNLEGDTDEEKKAHLSGEIQTALVDAGIVSDDVPAELVDFAAGFIYDEFSSGETVTADSILDYLGLTGITSGN